MPKASYTKLTLKEAFAQLSDPNEYSEYISLRPDGPSNVRIWVLGHVDPPEVVRADKLESELVGAFKSKLLKGEIRAAGFDSRAPVGPAPVEIAASAWRFLQFDFQEETAKGRDYRIEGLEIWVPLDVAKTTYGAEARCRALIEQYAQCGQQPATKEELWKEASKAIGPQLKREGFNKAWAAAAPESWKKQGRKRQESID